MQNLAITRIQVSQAQLLGSQQLKGVSRFAPWGRRDMKASVATKRTLVLQRSVLQHQGQ